MSPIWIQVVIAILLGIIAFNQYLIARNKLRLDLFPMRYKILEAWKKFLLSALDTTPVPLSEMQEFHRAVNESVLLMPKLSEYLREVYNNANTLNYHKGRINTAQKDGGGAPDKNWDEYERLSKWFTKELDSGFYRFTDYLSFHETRIKWFDELA